MTNTPADLTALAATAKTLGSKFAAEQVAAIAADEAATTAVNRIALAEALLDAELPAEAHVDLTSWEDEPNGYGTYDLDVAEAYIPNGDALGDLGGQGAIAAGHCDADGTPTGTDWDLFLIDGADESAYGLVISVAKVYAWLREQR